MRKDGYLIGAGVGNIKNSAQIVKNINSVTMRSRARRMMKSNQANKIKHKDATRGFESSKAGRRISKFIVNAGVGDAKGTQLFRTNKDRFLHRDMLKIMEKNNVSSGCNLKGAAESMKKARRGGGSVEKIQNKGSMSFSRVRYKPNDDMIDDSSFRIHPGNNTYSRLKNNSSQSTRPQTAFSKANKTISSFLKYKQTNTTLPTKNTENSLDNLLNNR